LREKRLNQKEQERRINVCLKVDDIIRKYNKSSDEDDFVKKPAFANLHPASMNFDAILQGKGGT